MEIARIYSVPLHLLQFQMNQTYASVEQLETAFVNHCLLPRVRMREEEIERKLLASYEVDTHYCKYNLNGLLRGDFKTRMEGYRILHSMGMPLNRILDLEDLNHVDGGDQSLAPLNMIPSDKLSEYHMTKPQGAAADSKRDLSVDELLDLKLKEQKND